MKNIISTLIILLSVAIVPLLAQERYENKTYGFSMKKPTGVWIETDHFSKLRLKHADFEFAKNNLGQFLIENSGTDFKGYPVKSLVLVSYMEKNPDRTGYRPTMSARIILNETKDFDELKKKVTNINSGFLKKVPEDLAFEIPPKTIDISGIKAVYYTYTFSREDMNGDKKKNRAYVCAIPNGSYYFELYFFDRPNEIDCTEIYNDVINSIKIEK